VRTRLLTALLLAGAASLEAQRLTATPARAEPGAIIRLALEGLAPRGEVRTVSGDMAGEPLHFVRADSGSWRAIGAVPVNAPMSLSARVLVTLASGRVDTVRGRVDVPPVPPPRAEPLTVDTAFTALDSAQLARVGRENARARDVGRRSHDTPRLWADAFLRPRASVVTSTFGTGRSFNNAVTSRHLGVDYRGALGDTVHASNRGVVVLVDTFLLAGKVLYVDHGAGVVTGYFHLSKSLVVVGDTVSRGQTIGLVGASGRVTASHLHWTARYGSLTVNPLDLVALDATWYREAQGDRSGAMRPDLP
jgi:murein DD-endopeptidase MepM/ murein hydrolase activator NlpD